MKKYTHSFQPAGLVRFKGEDAAKFLQGQTTCDVDSLTNDNAVYGAFCNPKGRMKTTFLLLKGWSDELLMLMDASQCDYMQSELSPYMAFFKAEYEIVSDEFTLVGVTDDGAETIDHPKLNFTVSRTENVISIHVPSRHPRQIEIHQAEVPEAYTLDETLPWHFWNVTDGFVWVNVLGREEFLPHDVELPTLDGVNFEKGCYTGQEIVARMHYRGDPKYARAVLIMDSALDSLPPVVSQLDSQGKSKKVGQLIDFVKTANDQTYALVTIKKDFLNQQQFQLSISEETSILCNVMKPNLG